MKNFYAVLTSGRNLLTLLLASLLLGSAGAAEAQQHLPNRLKANELFSRQDLKQKRTASATEEGKLARRAAATAKPRTGMEYTSTDSGWLHSTTTTYTYDGAGRVTEELVKTHDGTNLDKINYVYDAHGNEQEYTVYNWNGTSWEMSYGWQTLTTYGTEGRIEEVTYTDWDGEAWVVEDKEVYTYDSNGNLTAITEYDAAGSGWIAVYSTTLTYTTPNGAPTGLIFKEADENGALVNESRIIDIVFHSYGEIFSSYPKSYLEQIWENGNWVNEEKYEATFGDNNSSVGIYSEWENGAWVNEWRYTNTYDANGNETLWQEESWTGSVWDLDYGYKTNYTYNSANQITEMIEQNWDEETGAFKNAYRTVYSDFQIVTSAPLAADELLTAVYPNPTAGKLTISYKQTAAPATLQITDITGKVIITKQLAPTSLQQELDLFNLPAGLYMLHLNTGNTGATRKVIRL